MRSAIDLTGNRIGRLKVISYVGKSKWRCVCRCGKFTVVSGDRLRNRITKSCGCYRRDLHTTMHGLSTHRLYRIWNGMKDRCYNSNNKRDFPRYGGRGITVCDKWLRSFLSFYFWSYSNGYEDYLSIDRRNTNKGYSPDNCRWSTPIEQAQNRRCNCGCPHCCSSKQ